MNSGRQLGEEIIISIPKEKKNQLLNLDDLPDELLQHILSFCKLPTLLNLRLVYKRLYQNITAEPLFVDAILNYQLKQIEESNNTAKELPYTIDNYKHQLKQMEKLIHRYTTLNKENSAVIKEAQKQFNNLRKLGIDTTLGAKQNGILSRLLIIHAVLSIAAAATTVGFHWSSSDLFSVTQNCSGITFQSDNLIFECQNAVNSYLGSGFSSFYSIGAAAGATIRVINLPKKLKEKYLDCTTPTFSVKKNQTQTAIAIADGLISKRELVSISLGLAVSIYLIFAKPLEFNTSDYLVADNSNSVWSPIYQMNLSSLSSELQAKSESYAGLDAISGFANTYGIFGSVLFMWQILKMVIESLQKTASYSKQRFFQPAKPVDEEVPLLFNSTKNKQMNHSNKK